MIKVREPRFWTVVVVAGLSAFAIGQGVTALRFSLADLSAGRANLAARLTPFVGNTLVGDLAARKLLLSAPPAAPEDAVALVGKLLIQGPLDSGAWLDLAIARRAAAAPTESVATALALSATTGPNEQRIMVGRTLFALPFWTALPPDAKSALILDLVGGWPGIADDERTRLTAMLRDAPDAAGEQLRAALLLNGSEGAAIAAALTPSEKVESPDGKPGAGSTEAGANGAPK